MVASTIAYIKRARAAAAAEQAQIDQFEQAQLNRHRELNTKLLGPLFDVRGNTRNGQEILIASSMSKTTADSLVDRWYKLGADAWAIPSRND